MNNLPRRLAFGSLLLTICYFAHVVYQIAADFVILLDWLVEMEMDRMARQALGVPEIPSLWRTPETDPIPQDVPVFVLYRDKKVYIVEFDGEGKGWITPITFIWATDVTHWQPIPKLPKVEG